MIFSEVVNFRGKKTLFNWALLTFSFFFQTRNLRKGLKKKLVLLEEFNSDLAKLKTTAEDEAMQLDQQLMRSRMENKKLQD